jgi:hypothetical protein
MTVQTLKVFNALYDKDGNERIECKAMGYLEAVKWILDYCDNDYAYSLVLYPTGEIRKEDLTVGMETNYKPEKLTGHEMGVKAGKI